MAQESIRCESIYRSFDPFDGLSSIECHHIFEDDRNYLWISTDEGLSRFDGKEFRHFGVSEGLSHPFVIRLKSMQSGRVLAWTFSGALFELYQDEIIPIHTDLPIIKSNSKASIIIDVIESRDGFLYISTSSADGYTMIDPCGQVCYMEEATGEMTVVHFTEIEDQLFMYLSASRGPEDMILMKSSESLDTIDRASYNTFQNKPVVQNSVMYFCLFDQLIRFDGQRIQRQQINTAPWNISIIDNQLWLCSRRGGAYAYDIHTLEKRDSLILKNNLVTCLYEDQGGGIWASSLKKGLIKYANYSPFVLKHPSIESLNFTHIASNKMNNLKISARVSNQYHADLYDINLDDRKVRKIDSKLIGYKPLFYDPTSRRYHYGKSQDQDILYYSVDSAFNKKDITLDVNTSVTGAILNNTDVKEFERFDQFGSDAIYLYKDSLHWIRSGQKIFLNAIFPVLNTDIRALELNEDKIWIGTKSQGLFLLQNNTLQQFNEKDGLLSNHVTKIESIHDSLTIVATNKGIMALSLNTEGSLLIQNFLNEHVGLKEVDIESVAISKDTLWLLSNNYIQGIPLQMLQPDQIGIEKAVISSLTVDDQLIDLNLPYRIPSSTKKMAFELSKIDFTNQQDAFVYVKLDGYDQVWQKTHVGHFQYSNLSPGQYCLNVAASLDQIKEQRQGRYRFYIPPPWFKQLWFVPALILVGFILYKLGLNYYKKRKKRNEERLDQLKRLKMKAMMAQINPHFTFNVLNSIQSLILQNDKMEAVEKLSDFSDLVRCLLEITDRRYVTLKEELDILRKYIDFEQLRMCDAFQYKIDVQEQLLEYKIPPLLIQPLVENAIWHGMRSIYAGQGNICIEIRDVGDQIVFKIQDNGQGFKTSNPIKKSKHKSKGMTLVQERIRLINGPYHNTGKFSLLQSNTGTTVSFYLIKQS